MRVFITVILRRFDDEKNETYLRKNIENINGGKFETGELDKKNTLHVYNIIIYLVL